MCLEEASGLEHTTKTKPEARAYTALLEKARLPLWQRTRVCGVVGSGSSPIHPRFRIFPTPRAFVYCMAIASYFFLYHDIPSTAIGAPVESRFTVTQAMIAFIF